MALSRFSTKNHTSRGIRENPAYSGYDSKREAATSLGLLLSDEDLREREMQRQQNQQIQEATNSLSHFERATVSARDEIDRRKQGLSYNDNNVLDRTARGETPKVVQDAAESAETLARMMERLKHNGDTDTRPEVFTNLKRQEQGQTFDDVADDRAREATARRDAAVREAIDRRTELLRFGEQREYDAAVRKGRAAGADSDLLQTLITTGTSQKILTPVTQKEKSKLDGNRVIASRKMDQAGVLDRNKNVFSNYTPLASYMTEDEVDYYSYLYATANEATADQWLNSISAALEKRIGVPEEQWVSRNPRNEDNFDRYLAEGKAKVDFAAMAQTDNQLPSYMNQDEKDIYAYTLARFGQEDADSYYNSLRGELNRRKYEPYRKNSGSENWQDLYGMAINTFDTVNGVAHNIFGGIGGGAEDIWEYITTGEIDPYSAGNEWSHIGNAMLGGVEDTIDSNALKTAYQIGTSALETAIITYVSAGVGKLAGALGATANTLGGTAHAARIANSVTRATSAAIHSSRIFTNTVQNAKERGVEDDKAVALGLISAAIEGITENMSLSKWLEDPTKLWRVGLSNATEEVTANILTTAADILVTQDQSAWRQAINAYMADENLSEEEAFARALWDKAGELGVDFIGGFASGAALSAPSVMANKRIQRANKAADIVNTAATEVFAPEDQAKAAVEMQEVPAPALQDETETSFVDEVLNNDKNNGQTSVKQQLQNGTDPLGAMEPVATYNNDTYTFQGQQHAKQFVVDLLADTGYLIHREGFGDVIIDSKRINKGISYLKTKEDILAFATVPKVIENGIVIDTHPGHKGRPYDTITFGAPVMINGIRGNVGVVLRQQEGKNYYKVHRILTPDGGDFSLEQSRDTAEPAANAEHSSDHSPTDNVSMDSISQTPPTVNTNSSTESPSFTDAVFSDTTETSPADDTPDFVKNVWDTPSENVSPAPPTADDGRRERFNEVFEQQQGMDMDAVDTEDGASRREHADRYEATLPDDVDALTDVVEDLQKKAELAHREFGNGSQTLPINIQLFAARRKLAWAMLQQADIFDGDSETNFTKKYKRQIKHLKKANVPLEVLKNVLENGGVRYDYKSDAKLQAQVTELLGEDTGSTTEREMELFNRVVGDFANTLNDVETAAATELVNRLSARGDHDHALTLYEAKKRHGTETARALRQHNDRIEYDSPASGSIFLHNAMDTSLDEELGSDGNRRGSERFYDVARQLQKDVKKNEGADPAVTMRGLLSKLANKDDIGKGQANATIARKIRKALKKGDAPLVALHQKLAQADDGNIVAARDALAEYLGLTFADAETRQKVDAIFAEIRAIEGDDLAADKARHAKLEEAFKVAAKRLPVTFEDKWNDYRRTAMLSAPKTHIKNYLSNAINMPQRKIDEAMSWLLEQWFFRKSKGRNHLKTQSLGWSFTEHGKQIRQMVEDDTERMMLDLKNVEKYMNNSDNNTLKQYRDIWADSGAIGSVIGGSSKAVKWLLEKGDAPFTRSAYRDALGQIMTARGATEITDEMRDLARERALVATFKAENAISDFILNMRNHSGTVGRVAIDTITPFVTTPANIMAEAYRHSPINIISGAVEVHKAIKQGKSSIEVAQAINSLAKGITGTIESGILFGIGFALAKSGVIKLKIGTGTGKGTDDKSAEELSGEREYALQVGNYSISLDWMQPAVFPFIYGAAALNAITNTKRSDEEDDRWWNEALNWTDLAFDAMTAGYGSLLDMSMLQGVVDLFRSNSGDKSDIAKNIGTTLLTSYPSQFMPAILTGFIRATDNKKRSYTGASLTEKALAKVGITHFLPEEKDIWGDTVWKNAAEDNLLGAWFLNAFSPSNIVKGNAANDESGISNELLDLYYGGEKGMAGKAIPSGVNSTWMFADSNTPVLESKQRDEIEDALGNAYRQAAEELMRGDRAVKVSDDRQVTWKNASEEDKLTALGKVFSRAADQVKAQYGIVTTEGSDPQSWGVDGVDEETYKQFLHDTQDYIKTDNASEDSQKWDYIHGMKTDDQTKANLWGRENLQRDDREKYEGWGLSSEQYNWFNYFSDEIKQDYEAEMDATDGKKYAEREAKQNKKERVFELIDKMDLTTEQKWRLYRTIYNSADKSAPWYSSSDRGADWWADVWKEN